MAWDGCVMGYIMDEYRVAGDGCVMGFIMAGDGSVGKWMYDGIYYGGV